MSIRKVQLVNNEIYHIIVRGVGDTAIFQDGHDYYRGIFSIYEFNTTAPIEIRKRREARRKFKTSGGKTSVDTRDLLVEILAFCFMPNHMHLLIKQLKDNGITKFMKKVGTGYATYFNKKYNRRGHLFQNKFLSVLIRDDIQLATIFAYIHTNPTSLMEPNWKENGIVNFKKVIKFLENYKWSSYSDYVGKNNFSSVTERNFLSTTMNGKIGCRDIVENYIKYKEKRGNFSGTDLE